MVAYHVRCGMVAVLLAGTSVTAIAGEAAEEEAEKAPPVPTITVVYDIEAFVDEPEQSDEKWEKQRDGLASTLRDLVEPYDWQRAGGNQASLEREGNYFVVNAPFGHHRQIMTLLEALAQPTRELGKQKIAERVRQDRLEDEAIGRRRVSVTWDAMPMHEAAKALSEQLGVPVRVDWSDLEFYEFVDEDFSITLHLQDVPVEQVLDRIVEQMEMVEEFVIAGEIAYGYVHGAIRIGKSEELTVVRVYDVRDIVDEAAETIDEDADDPMWLLMDAIRDTVDPYNWRWAGGTVSSLTDFNGRLLVGTTVTNHKQITLLLDDLRR
ncbi:MAG: hypothetical protein WD294_07970 [Phycisphaeraceae bacterium]